MTRERVGGVCWPARRSKGRTLDTVHPPPAPLDILAEQIIAEVAASEEWKEDELYELVRRAVSFIRARAEMTSTP